MYLQSAKTFNLFAALACCIELIGVQEGKEFSAFISLTSSDSVRFPRLMKDGAHVVRDGEDEPINGTAAVTWPKVDVTDSTQYQITVRDSAGNEAKCYFSSNA